MFFALALAGVWAAVHSLLMIDESCVFWNQAEAPDLLLMISGEISPPRVHT